MTADEVASWWLLLGMFGEYSWKLDAQKHKANTASGAGH
jgi:hypothetical protein